MEAESHHEILTRKSLAEDYLAPKRELWSTSEKLFHNRLSDAVSQGTKSQVFDPKLSTLILERGYRVMAQLPTGKVKGISNNDVGGAKMKNLLLDKYVMPNANAQFDFLTKLRMMDIYSNIYGNFFALVDWDVKQNGYIGPDMWLLNIRDVFPQVGAVSLNDSDYTIVRTWKGLSYFERLADSKGEGFKNIPEIITKLKDLSGAKGAKDDSMATSEREKDQYPSATPAKKMGYFEVLTQYERDKWTDYCVDADMTFREIDNPHDNGELPIVCKYAIPLLDDFMGMGNAERGAPMQNVVNSIWNLYLDACKMSIFPPTLINKNQVASYSSVKWGAAEKWLVRGNVNTAVAPINLSPQGIASFNNTFSVAVSSLLNMFGTTDTSVTSQTDPGMGKTPQALRMQEKREGSGDNADRFYMERFINSVMKRMVNLLSIKQPKAINLRLFEDEIEELKRTYPEVAEKYDDKTGKLMIKKGGSVLYDYEMIPGSTYEIDQKAQQDNLVQLMQMLIENPDLAARLEQEGYNVKFGEIFKRVVSNLGVQDWAKILEEQTEEEKAEAILQRDAQQLMAAMEQSLGGQQNLNQIPPEQARPPGVV